MPPLRTSSGGVGNKQQGMPTSRLGKAAQEVPKSQAHSVKIVAEKRTKGYQKVSVANQQKGGVDEAPCAVVLPSVGVYAADITNTIIPKLPIVSVPVSTVLLTSPDTAEHAVSKILADAKNGAVLGFDMEIKPRFVKGEAQEPPSVMQVCIFH